MRNTSKKSAHYLPLPRPWQLNSDISKHGKFHITSRLRFSRSQTRGLDSAMPSKPGHEDTSLRDQKYHKATTRNHGSAFSTKDRISTVSRKSPNRSKRLPVIAKSSPASASALGDPGKGFMGFLRHHKEVFKDANDILMCWNQIALCTYFRQPGTPKIQSIRGIAKIVASVYLMYELALTHQLKKAKAVASRKVGYSGLGISLAVQGLFAYHMLRRKRKRQALGMLE